jgi:hypothetical protein
LRVIRLLLKKANYVNISLGANEEMIANNAELIRNKDLTSRIKFIEKNPKVNLPADINVDLCMDNFSELVGSTTTNTTPLKGEKGTLENSWVDITSKGLKPSIINTIFK